MPYVIKAQGYDASPRIRTKAAAITAVRQMVKRDVLDCRRHFGRAVVEKFKDSFWEVKPIHHPMSPLWSRYTIHQV